MTTFTASFTTKHETRAWTKIASIAFRMLDLREAGIRGVVAAVLFVVSFVGPAVVTLGGGGGGLLQPPPDLVEGGQDPILLTRGPLAHAARKLTFSSSAGASECSRRSARTRRARACTRATASSRVWPSANTPDRPGTSAIQRPSVTRST